MITKLLIYPTHGSALYIDVKIAIFGLFYSKEDDHLLFWLTSRFLTCVKQVKRAPVLLRPGRDKVEDEGHPAALQLVVMAQQVVRP